MKHQVHNRICQATMQREALKAIKRQLQSKGMDTTETDNQIRAWQATIEDLRKSCI